MMPIFPFSKAEWQRVTDASHAVLNAALLDDRVLRESHFVELIILLDELRHKYGDHPVLRETEADFLDEPSLQREAYHDALRSAAENALPTLSIRISLARLLLEDFGDHIEARSLLIEGRGEISENRDEAVKAEWLGLLQKCEESERTGQEDGS